jgi:hypothetical protein
MEEINKTVVRLLKAQKAHKKTLALWEELWSVYQEEGEWGADEFIEDLLETPEKDD